jgi:hypothetical protein
MGVGSRRPPLPAPTDLSSANTSVVGVSDDLATDISRRTDRTSYSIPEDGSPVTITTKNTKDAKNSQTSLLIEYYEAHTSKHPERGPSVRVRVTPSSRRSKRGGEHIKISKTNAAGESSQVRRISVPLGGRTDAESVENSSASDLSGRHPIEVDVLHNASELSSSGGAPTRYIAAGSDISSMPPESIMDIPAAAIIGSKRRGGERTTTKEVVENDILKAPSSSRSRGVRKEQLIAQQVVEKLKRDGLRTRESGKRRHSGSLDRKGRSRSVSNENFTEDVKTSKSRSSKVRDDSRERNLHPSEISVVSSMSTTSNTSINNPKLLSAVEEAVKKFILPEITALREENEMLKSKTMSEENTRESRGSISSRSRGESKGISKSSSLPNVSHRSDSVSEDRLIEEGSGRRRSSRRSSRGSDKSYDTTVREESSRRKVSREKDKNHLKEGLALAAGAAVGYLGAKALKHHDSTSSIDRDRKRRHKSSSRSRNTSLTESRSERRSERRSRGDEEDDEFEEEDSHNYIPPLPMQSTLDSELTRDSILSADTERPASRSSLRAETPTKAIREVSRGSPLHVHSPGAVASIGSPRSFREYEAEHGAESREVDEHTTPRSHRSAKMGFAAAGLGAAAGAAAVAAASRLADKQGISPNRAVSPIQSENSYLHDREETMEHPRVRSIRSDNSMSSERRRRKSDSPVSAASSPAGIIRSKKRPEGISLESPYEILPDDEFAAETPRPDDFDQWLQREHAQNDRYREELDHDSFISHSDVDGYRDTLFTDDSRNGGLKINARQNIRTVGANPEYVSTPDAAASAVASLQNPSMISVHSSVRSLNYEDRPPSQAESYAAVQDQFAVPVAPQRLPGADSKQHWEQVRDRYMAMTDGNDRDFVSPAQSEARSIEEKPIMHSNYVPVPGDMPDLSYALRDEDDLQTNPSIVEGKLGEGIEMSPYPNQPISHQNDHHLRDTALLGAAGGLVGLGLAKATKKSADSMKSYEQNDNVRHIPNEPGPSRDIPGTGYSSSPAQNKDEGYISANPGPMSPVPHPLETRDIDFDGAELDYNDEMDMDMDDPFTTQKHLRHSSGYSHGMESPLYDNATGKGIDRILSKDVVALMDHLTVRDAQRNARDTEILVTLVRSAAEMRNNFDEIKRFIAEQDRHLVNNMDRAHESTVQRLAGPRPFPTNSPRARKLSEDTDENQSKRKNMLKRALKGLSMRSSNDLTKIEDMLMHLLQEVEGLKTTQSLQRSSAPQTQTASLNSYEHLRAAPDSGYEPEGRAGTNSSPAQSGYLSNNSSRHINGMHSGYGLRGSDGNRISTVLEGDEEGDDGVHTPKASKFNDSNTPPTNEVSRSVPLETPPEQSAQFSADPTPRTDKSKSRGKSLTSSLFGGVPKISRWSKTTASTLPDSAPNSAKKNRPFSSASRSGSDLQDYDAHEVDALRSGDSLTDDHNRAGSPLFPEDYDYDDPKYQAHRNSLNLEHPQPRPGPTNRHQTHLETQAMVFEHPQSFTPDADQWGSAPALALNKSRFSQASSAARQSPIHSDDGYSLQSDEFDAQPILSKAVDDGPLVPKVVTSSLEPNYGMYGVPMMNSGMHIASSLAPIEEVRKSLETDRSSVRHVSFY